MFVELNNGRAFLGCGAPVNKATGLVIGQFYYGKAGPVDKRNHLFTVTTRLGVDGCDFIDEAFFSMKLIGAVSSQFEFGQQLRSVDSQSKHFPWKSRVKSIGHAFPASPAASSLTAAEATDGSDNEN